MNGSENVRDELDALCEAAVEGGLTAEQRTRLEQLVLEDPAAKRFYVEYLHQHACLQWSGADPAYLGGEGRLRLADTSDRPTPRSRRDAPGNARSRVTTPLPRGPSSSCRARWPGGHRKRRSRPKARAPGREPGSRRQGRMRFLPRHLRFRLRSRDLHYPCPWPCFRHPGSHL